MFRAAYRSSSEALNCICSLWFTYCNKVKYLRSFTLLQYLTRSCKYSLELLMMCGVPLETSWAFNKRWNNKFYYKVASCWLFLPIQFSMFNYSKGDHFENLLLFHLIFMAYLRKVTYKNKWNALQFYTNAVKVDGPRVTSFRKLPPNTPVEKREYKPHQWILYETPANDCRLPHYFELQKKYDAQFHCKRFGT